MRRCGGERAGCLLTGSERRRRWWSPDEKLVMVCESCEAGGTVSMVAREHGVNPNQLFPESVLS
ncbi:IS2 insertion element repressor InsA; KpLE2 phage-like element (fragment) (plasmid) [Cupriavidus taiwanensis]